MNIQIRQQDDTPVKYTVLGFAGGERHIQLEAVTLKNDATLSIQASLTSSNDVMDLLLIENALRHAFGQTIKINVELPYLPYARQDRVCAEGQAFSLEVMAKVLQLMSINQLVTWDCHSQVGIDLTGAYNVTPAEIIQSDAALSALLKQPESVLVCPDKGAVARCENIQKTMGLDNDLTGKCAVISDDICDGGYTFIKIAEQLKAKGAARIVLFVTHGIFSKGLDVFDGLIDEVITTNSLPQQANEKLRTINFNYTFKQ